MYGRFDLESFGILDRSSHMEVRLYFHQLFWGIKKCLIFGFARRPYPKYLMISFPCFLFASTV